MAQLTKTNIMALLAPHPPRTNFHVIQVDEEYTVRVAKTIGRFPWHYHPHGDEGWLVFEGRLRIDTQDGSIDLERGDFAVIPKGMRHSPEALVPNTIVAIFNKRHLGMVLDEPQQDLGGFREEDISEAGGALC
jgi:mannose-6-phosphate isomerase-like protein (cupin superfamily)